MPSWWIQSLVVSVGPEYPWHDFWLIGLEVSSHDEISFTCSWISNGSWSKVSLQSKMFSKCNVSTGFLL